MKVPRRVTPEEQIDLVDHLDELRSRIIIVLAVLAVAMSVLFWKSGEILAFPEPANPRPDSGTCRDSWSTQPARPDHDVDLDRDLRRR